MGSDSGSALRAFASVAPHAQLYAATEVGNSGDQKWGGNRDRAQIVEIAAQLDHNPTVSLDTYAHVMAEQAGGERVGAEEQIAAAREALAADDSQGAQLSLVGV